MLQNIDNYGGTSIADHFLCITIMEDLAVIESQVDVYQVSLLYINQ